MVRPVEFLIDGVVAGDSDLVRVIGRCCDEPIRVGDVFHSVYRIVDSDDVDESNADHAATQEVNLKVVSIQAYGQSIDVMGSGMTGALGLVGEGAHRVVPNFAIGSAYCPTSTTETSGPPIGAHQ